MAHDVLRLPYTQVLYQKPVAAITKGGWPMPPTTASWLKGRKGTPFIGIGPLESEILAIIWERKRVTVRDVYETLRERRQIAYTTVMTVMGNLVKKGLLSQDRGAVAYVYVPAIPGDEVATMVLDSVIERLFGGRANVALAHLLGLEGDISPQQAEKVRAYAAKHFAA